MSEKTALNVIVIELAILILGLYYAGEKIQTAAQQAAASPLAGALGSLGSAIEAIA